MAVCDIAGLRVNIKNMTGRTGKQAQPYLSADQNEETADIVIDVSSQRVEAAKKSTPNSTAMTGNTC